MHRPPEQDGLPERRQGQGVGGAQGKDDEGKHVPQCYQPQNNERLL